MTAILQDPIFQDEAKAREWLEARVWPQGPVCPHCGVTSEHVTKLEGAKHRPGLYQCNECREQFTAIWDRAHPTPVQHRLRWHRHSQTVSGQRGIVLLLLYLALDDADDRPLIIDQPEENLDQRLIQGRAERPPGLAAAGSSPDREKSQHAVWRGWS
jgi:hypothetical protein